MVRYGMVVVLNSNVIPTIPTINPFSSLLPFGLRPFLPLKSSLLFHVLDVRGGMAAAEAKPPRKHSENNFPAKDDDYRDSKLLSTPSFSSNSERSAASDHRAHGFNYPTKAAHIPKSYQTVDCELKSDKPPDFQHHKGFAVGWAKTVQAGLDNSSVRIASKTTVSSEEHQNIEELEHRVCKGYPTESNNESVNMTKKTDCMDEFHYIEDHFTDLHNFDSPISKQGEKVSFDLESHWTRIEKTKPWWRSASKDELASLVARKSLENLENCDLPQPRTKHQSKDESTCPECFGQDCFLTSPFTEMQFSSLDGYNRGMHPSGGMDERQFVVGSVGHLLRHQDHFSVSRTGNEEYDSSSIANLNSSKAQLLEALCHSQTRAREAEKAAQEADTEKKHIVSLFLRQATQLFAYKQWFQLLQLQNLCLQLRNKDHFSDVLPWVPCKDRQFNQPRNRRKKRDRDHHKFTMYDIAFAVGLGLAGATLLIGWTTGWLVPMF
ncbi:uncharacterized protein LOC120068032 isoform X2 [Benincasa hispida]|uniref:uncharacterized protein LOC120068032 isoform X2 n=1 Tax=Benincasa hispida TaxID=102211 RepID=UPI001901ED32|nr:uncharacterized protein LOC120068032 isoform X2 [Benincasa hispida]